MVGINFKSVMVISLVLSMLLVPSTASVFGVVKCATLCLLRCGGNPFCAIPCFLECKKTFPLNANADADGRDDHFLCTTGCAISNCFTSSSDTPTGLTEAEMMKDCVHGCDYSCKARRSYNKLE